MRRIPVFKALTETERSSLTQRSSKLFTLSSLYGASNALLSNHRDQDLGEQIEIAVKYWSCVCENMPDWDLVLKRKVSAAEIRRDHVHCYAVTLAGIGKLGSSLLSIYEEGWEQRLTALRQIDWQKSNPEWEGRIMHGGQIGKSRGNVEAMSVYLKKAFNLPLTSEEEHLEKQRR